MNKIDIVISHIESCKSLQEAIDRINDPLKGFGFRLTKNEQDLCIYYARLYFKA